MIAPLASSEADLAAIRTDLEKLALGGGKITFNDKSGKLACSAKGVYSYKLNGRVLTFKKVSDPNKCAGRIAVLAASFTKKFASSPGGY